MISLKKLSACVLPLLVIVFVGVAGTIFLPLLAPKARAFGGLTDEAVTVWQHRDVLSPTGYDIWYSWLGRPFTGAATSTLAWHASGGPVPQAAPIAKLTGDDKNAHVSINGTVAVAVWQHASGEGASPGQWDIIGAKWNSSTTSWDLVPPITYDHALPSTLQDDLDPTVAVDSNGNAIVVWVFRPGISDPTGNRQLAYAVLIGTTWTVGDFTINAGGRASLPEVTTTSVPATPGGPLAHKAVCIWSDVGFDTVPIDMRTHKMWYTILDNTNFGSTPVSPTATQIGTEAPPAILDVGFANYTGADLDPFGAVQRVGLTADASNHAYAMWGGSRPALEGVVGAILDVTNPNPVTNWSPMLTTTGTRFLGLAGSESPDDALTTPTGDLIGVFNALGNIEHTMRLATGFFDGAVSYTSELIDERPSNAGLSATEMAAVNWGGPVGPTSDMIFSIGTVTPGTSVTWTTAAHIVPGGLLGDDMFPEIASGFAGPPISAPSLALAPSTATNPVGSPHTVTATVTQDGPVSGVNVSFTVSGSNTFSPASGSCTTGSNGQCTFTFTGNTAGDDTITATANVAGQILTAKATKKFVTAPTLTLTPAQATNPERTSHTVTATVTNNGPASGAAVTFTVTGNNVFTPPGGACTTDANGQCTFTFTGGTAGDDTIKATAVVGGTTLTANAMKRFTDPPIGLPPAPPPPTNSMGRMTGGAVYEAAAVKVIYGLELRCNTIHPPAKLEVSWKGADGKDHAFHLESTTTIACSTDPAIDGQPLAGFNVMEGSGTGLFDGASGAVANWTLKDAGDPGVGKDTVRLEITAGGIPVLSAGPGTITRGKHRAQKK